MIRKQAQGIAICCLRVLHAIVRDRNVPFQL